MVLQVGVLGAGVVGLTTALRLQEQHPDIRITLIADAFNTETTSDGAAGIFRPGTSFCVGSDEATRTVIRDSFEYYSNVINHNPARSTGVSEKSGYIFSSKSAALVRNALIEDIVPQYRAATDDELRLCPGQWKYGSYFSTVLTECRYFLPWCMAKFENNLGNVLKTRITDLRQLKEYGFDIIFNCMGLGAKEIFNDRKLVPIRGQVLKVSAPWLKNFFYCEYDTYIIPGLDNVTLGGCRNYDSYDLTTSRYDSAAIMERCSQLVPRLSNALVQKEWVGLRPHRDPTRIEVEAMAVNGKIVKVVHNYGHGGYGVTTAPGCAKLAVNLFDDAHKLGSCKL